MIHIALTIDHKFVRFCAVTMVSILKNNPVQDITFHILDDCSLSAKDMDSLSHIADEFKAGIVFHHVRDEQIGSYTLKWESQRLSKVVFYRCILPSVLPTSLSRVLYMDCDVLVLGNLDELWNTDLQDYALAAVPDAAVVNPRHCARLHYDVSYNYINGGVLLLNLDYWREHHTEEQCKVYYREHIHDIVYNDQDLLNGLLFDKKKLVDMKWNLQESAFRKKTAHLYPRQLMDNCVILHYSSRKPWQYHCMHPLRNLFFEYQELTEWKGCSPQQSWWNRLHRFIHLLPYKLKLKEDKYMDYGQVNK